MNDSTKYKNRTNIYQSNSNLFLSNNNNPFLITPFQVPTNVAKQTIVNDISSIVSTLIGDLSSIINIDTYTLCISTITPCPTNTLTISSGIFNLNSLNANFNTSNLNVSGNAYFNYIDSGTIDVGTVNFTTMTGSTITTNTLQVNSTINASTINTSTLSTNTLQVNSTINASTINTSTLSTLILEYSSIYMNPGLTIPVSNTTNNAFPVTFPSIFTGGIPITIGGVSHIIPFY